MTAVKICGVNSAAAAREAVAAGADWLGYVFFTRSPRFVSPAQAAGLAQAGGRAVGLFVAPEDEEIAATLAQIRLDVLQLYVDSGRARAIRQRFGVPVWRAVGVTGAADLPADDEGLDGFVIEPKPPAGASRPGGNAAALDWGILAGWAAPAPWLLAGGLTPGNVAAAVAASGAKAVDVSSGVEIAPGEKSPALIRRFVEAARACG